MPHDSVISSIVSALQSGNLKQAERYCQGALAHDPDEPDLLVLLGLTLQRQERPADALVPFARLAELHPGDSTHWVNYATALHRAGDATAAREAAVKAVALDAGDDPTRLEQTGLLCLELGEPRAARAALLRASEQVPEAAQLRIHAARASIACHDIQAGELLLAWRDWLPLPDDLQLQLADLLTQVSETWDALELLEDLARRKPTDWAVQLLLAKVYERVNRLEQAEAKLGWIEATLDDTSADTEQVRHELGIQRSQLAMRGRDHARAVAMLEAAGPRYSDDTGYYFLLAKAKDRAGDTAAAMAVLETAHKLQIEELRASNPQLLEPDAPLLPGVTARVSESDYLTWPTLRSPDAGQSPVFVVGFPRSGTTLLEQMLDAHPYLQSMDERPFLNILAGQLHSVGIEVPGGLGRLTQRDCDELRKGYVLMGCRKISRRWDVRLVDKNPLNMLWLPMLHRLFPQAKVILAVRHPCDVIWSCYLQNFRAASLASACRSLQYLAHAYVAAMRYWLHHAALFQPDVLVSRYEDLVDNAPLQTRKIAAFLDLSDADAMLEYATRAREKGFIKTPSYTQVVEPINARSVGQWQRYRPFFERVLPIVRPMLEHWGYDVPPAAADG